jgi:outer membrane protein OmpA-like peptidoglycan-associated protein
MTDVSKLCARLGVVALVALGTTACSSVPDWVDPTTWVGGGDDSHTALPSQDQDADAQSGETPDLAAIPDKPEAPSTQAQQQQVAQSLSSDRSDAQYSADALRGGTEPVAAAPPPPPAPTPADTNTKVASATPSDDEAPAPPPPAPTKKRASTGVFGTTFDAETDKPVQEADADIDTNTGETTAAASPSTSDMTASAAPPPPPPPAASALPPAQPSPQQAAPQQQVAMNNPAPAPAQIAAPAPAQPVGGMPTAAQINPTDAQLGFQPSSAPPLDPTIGQFVPQPIIARYAQTSGDASMHQPHVAASAMMASAAPAPRSKSSGKAMGGPEMSGAVVANLDALNQVPSEPQASAYANAQGMPPSSVVFFPGDGTLLNAEGKLRIRAAAEEFKRQGGSGFIRIVGHASSRTANMPVEKHLEVIFNKSQDRANAVAQEMIKDGVPANRVLVEAVGDSQPVYYESMPKGEDGNRRAEIFLQS